MELDKDSPAPDQTSSVVNVPSLDVDVTPEDVMASVPNGAPSISPAAGSSPAEIVFKLFDSAHYAAQSGLRLPSKELFSHYQALGAAQGLSPHPDFDAKTYVQLNPDLPRDPLKAFEHYARHGCAERRYASAERLARDVSIVQRAGLFDRDFYEADTTIDLSVYPNSIVHYLTRGWKMGKRPNPRFDDAFYVKYYSDAAKSLVPPFVHYLGTLSAGPGEARYQNEKEAAQDLTALKKSGIFDRAFYKDRYRKLIPEGCDLDLHFLTTGQLLFLDASPRFSTRYYVQSYGDIRSLVRPAIHYIIHGHMENRQGVSASSAVVDAGAQIGNPGLPNLLLVLHEATRTGAPILGFNLARHLSRQFNVVVWLLRPGVIEKDLASHAVAVVKAPPAAADVADSLKSVIRRFQIDVAALNSAVCHSLSGLLFELKVPFVSLVHEFRDYTLPRGNLAKLAMFSDSVICPSSLVSDSLKEECMDYLGWVPNHIEVSHQGHCLLPPLARTSAGKEARGLPLKVKAALARKPGRPVVLGAGWVHMRKGVELFIQIAQMYCHSCDPDALFVWVGAGYAPEAELGYSVWLKSQIEIAGLKDNVLFVEETRSLQPFYDAADVFLMSSRLDPFPNVAIDASLAGVPVVAFERATGFVDVFKDNPELGRAVPYLDLNAAVTALSQSIGEQRQDAARRDRIRETAKTIFNFGVYADFVASRITAAIANARKVSEAAGTLETSQSIDESFFNSGLISGHLNHFIDLSPAYICLDLARKGIFPVKPRIGLNIASMAAETEFDALLATLSGTAERHTHPVHHLQVLASGHAKDDAALPKSIAAHVHAFETNGVLDIIMRLAASPVPIDIYVTSDEDEKIDAMKDSLSGQDGQIRWITTENRGRDLGPYLLGLPEDFWAHEIVGHFHVKASLHLDQKVTEQWKSFIYDHLIGSTVILSQIFAIFGKNPSLGLLFAEDPCQIGWTRNAEAASDLAIRLGITDALPQEPEFPIGNMYWARSAALAPLRKLGLSWDDLPDEPLPADGTLLHALERLTPSVCKLAGYDWATVHHPTALRFLKNNA